MTTATSPTLLKPQPRDYLDEFARTGPDTLGGRYLRQFWHPVARSQDLANGDAKTIRILSETFTLYRGESGVAHISADRCPHRLAALGVGYVEGDSLRCIYHGWKFNETGRCVERPAEAGAPAALGQYSVLAVPRASGSDLRLFRRGRAAGLSALSGLRPGGPRRGHGPALSLRLFPKLGERLGTSITRPGPI